LLTGAGDYKCQLKGRYLTIARPNGGILTLCEVMAFGFINENEEEEVEDTRFNLLSIEDISCAQSSEGWGGKCERAYDGNTSGIYKDKSCTHTQKDIENTWWRADLQGAHYIDQIELFNREDCCSKRLSDFLIYVGDDEDYNNNKVCGDGSLLSGAGLFNCQLKGRFIHIVRPGGGILTLCEVKAYGAQREVHQEEIKLAVNVLRVQGVEATQSTVGWGGVPERAIDGNTSGNYKDNSCTHTEN